MAKTTLKLLIDPEKNSITYSKNYRIYSTVDPVSGITGFTDLVEDVIIGTSGTVDISNMNRSFRYSRTTLDWSLWYPITPVDLGEADDIQLEDDTNFYFEVKYEYDDGTINELDASLEINEIKLRFSQADPSLSANTFAPSLQCSDEKCTSIVVNTDPGFKPYEVDSAVGMYKELSFYTNKMFGHEVVYFRTIPEGDSGDYVFKEWTLYKNVDRKCIKALVPKNTFPSNDPQMGQFGLDFTLPFEIHMDNSYFQSIFGNTAKPRHRDFLYFPLINRMYEVQGAYLHRAIMMTPSYWKISLKKYNPNIDMLLTDDSRHFLDNVVQSSEQLFGDEISDDIKDGTMPEQYKTISARFDSSRNSIHPDLRVRALKYHYNHAKLIENYYDLGAISTVEETAILTNDSVATSTSINLLTLPSINNNVQKSYASVLAYQDSGLFKSWKNNALITTDKNIKGVDSNFIRVRGPFDTIPNHDGQSDSGRYIRIESYDNLSFNKQRNILTDVDASANPIVSFKVRESAIVYNAEPVFNTTSYCNLSYTALFNLNIGSDVVQFINGYDNATNKGIKVSAQFVKYTGNVLDGDLTITVTINTTDKTYLIPNFISGNWYGIIVSLSNEFNQCGVYLYSITEDVADIVNHNDFVSVYENESALTTSEFELTGSKYYIPSSNMWISNVRLFNTMIKKEDHEFILSQQYIKDESKLLIIDNCKPQVNLPYIAKNR
tara:strand:- start:1402 stop:3558 length:2157 start_codon:yes stop_codon:yes gene_type:complete